LENQRQYYEKLIQSNPKYIFAGTYADSGISGAKKDRPGFQAMLDAARNGSIDLIYTKSVSRFGRNVVLLLETVRELKSLGIGVVFEEQRIDTLSAEGEMLLSVLGSIAEEERKAVSSNIKWSVKHQYQQGNAMINADRLLGYDKAADGNLVINEKQAEVVRLIYARYLKGVSAYRIARALNENGVPSYCDRPWGDYRVLSILSNEKYKGDCLMQKTFVNEQGTEVKNAGQLVQYYMEDHHPAIVTREDWEKAQEIRNGRKCKTYSYSGRLHCAYCGAALVRRQNKWGVRWECATYLWKGKAACKGVKIPEHLLPNLPDGHWTVQENEHGTEKNYTYLFKEENSGK